MKRSNRRIKPITASKLKRFRAEQISAVEGMVLSSSMRKTFEGFDRDGLSGDERRSHLLAKFQKRTA